MPRAGLTPTKIAEAAAELAGNRDLGQLTLAEVAKSVGVKTPSLYNHVAGIEGLLGEMAVLAHDRLREAMATAAVGKAGDAAVFAVTSAYRRFAVERPGLYAAMMRMPDAAHARDPALRAAAERLLEVVQVVLEPYGLEDDDAIHVIRALRSAMHGFSDLERLGGFGYDVGVDESYHRLVSLVVEGLSRPVP